MKRPPGKQMRDRARTLRREKTEAEKLLWRFLRARRLDGFKFREQMWLSGFIADFACVEARLVVEADGGQHRFAKDYDERRSAAFAAQGYRTLRFTNDEILAGIDLVLANIRDALPSPSHPADAGRAPPSPLNGEGKWRLQSATPLPFGDAQVSRAPRDSAPSGGRGDLRMEGPKPSGLGG